MAQHPLLKARIPYSAALTFICWVKYPGLNLLGAQLYAAWVHYSQVLCMQEPNTMTCG